MANISEKTNNTKHLTDKKILIIVTQTKWGGAQKYVLELAQFLSKRNEVHIGYGEINNINQHFLDTCKKYKIKTIPLPYLTRKIDIGKDFLFIKELSRLLKKEKYNLIHLNSSKAGFGGSLAAKLYNMNPMNVRIRIVYTAHGFVFNEPLSSTKKKIYKTAETFSTGIEDLVITVSDFDKQSAIKNKVCLDFKMHTVHNGIDPKDYNFYNREEARKKLNLDNNKKYFGVIASFYKTKGHIYLIEAIKNLQENKSSLLNNHRWILIGEGPELDNIKELIKNNKLDNYIKLIQPQDDDWKYLPAFDYFVLPSIKEGLPYTILEAGLAKIPVIASKIGGIPEIITNKQTGLLTTAANPLSLASAMRNLSKDNKLAQNLANNNYNNIINNFSLDKTLKKTEELYLKLF
jgi:glycosyltransferase involved in cell wall biosynthesis